MLPRHVLVDFDGVIIQNKKCQKVVENRIVQYVARNYNISDIKEARLLNTFLYKKYGHTYWGLRDVPPIRHVNHTTLTDFNSAVYGPGLADEIIEATGGFECFQNDLENWQRFCSLCAGSATQNYIFSNAPKNWCDFFTGCINTKYSVSNLHDYIPDGLELLKPRKEIYQFINQDIVKHQPVVFIDDSVINLAYPLILPNWTNILFDPQNEHPIQKVNNNLYIATDLQRCHEIITKLL